MRYDKFTYIWPPRPEYKTTPAHLEDFETGEYYAMPKYNDPQNRIRQNKTKQGDESIITCKKHYRI